MPVEWPSENEIWMAYCPTAWADCARGLALNIGNAGDEAKAGEASASDSFFARSSLQVAQGQWSRKKRKSKWLEWPSAQTMSTPAPLLTWIFTLAGLRRGSAETGMRIVSHDWRVPQIRFIDFPGPRTARADFRAKAWFRSTGQGESGCRAGRSWDGRGSCRCAGRARA